MPRLYYRIGATPPAKGPKSRTRRLQHLDVLVVIVTLDEDHAMTLAVKLTGHAKSNVAGAGDHDVPLAANRHTPAEDVEAAGDHHFRGARGVAQCNVPYPTVIIVVQTKYALSR